MLPRPGRTPPGVRELKHKVLTLPLMPICRTPPGVRELKLRLGRMVMSICSRTPPGVRELKHVIVRYTDIRARSHPSRGA